MFVTFLAYDIWFVLNVEHNRSQKDFIGDIRINNQYCSYYHVFISVTIGFLLKLPESTDEKTKNIPIATFVVSLISNSLNLIFFLVPYSDSWPIEFLWLSHIICGQAVVIFTVFGLLGLLNSFMKRHPVN